MLNLPVQLIMTRNWLEFRWRPGWTAKPAYLHGF
jgi:hypothetical protein